MQTKLSAADLDLLNRHYGPVPSERGYTLHHQGQVVPVLMLPPSRLTWDQRLGYWAHVAPLADSLVLQINSFWLEDGPGQGWAIPYGLPKDPIESICSALGFREGWEASRPETVVVLGPPWRPFGARVTRARVLFLGCDGHDSFFPLSFRGCDLKIVARFARGAPPLPGPEAEAFV